MSARYLESIQEVTQWLGHKSLDEFIYLLLDNGYDDLDAISRATDAEIRELEELFSTEELRKSIRTLALALRHLGIGARLPFAGAASDLI